MQAISVKERKIDDSDVSTCEKVYLTFALGNREYGIELLKVRKLVGITTPVPKVHRYVKIDLCSSHLSPFFPGGIIPQYVKGIITLQGRVIPIIDLRLKLKFHEAVYTHETSIIIIDSRDKPAGIIVDKILGTLDVKSEEIEDVLPIRNEINTEYLLGKVIINEKAKILLDIDKVLNAE